MKKPLGSVIFLFTTTKNNQHQEVLLNSNDIVIEKSRKDLSINGGLVFYNTLWNHLNIDGHLSKILPKKSRNSGLTALEKLRSIIFGFISGVDCLDDFDDLNHDLVFQKLAGCLSSTALGKFLRQFRLKDIEKLQDFLPHLALKLRKNLFPHSKKFILTMDSTHHQQWGKKMEGVSWNYKNIWGLDSQNCFDEYGFSYGFDLRPGSTFSSNGAESMMRRVFKLIPKGIERYFRADSAYSKLTIYNELINSNVKFAICLKENIWGMLLDKYEFKMGWKKTKIKFFDSDQCQISSCGYPIQGLSQRSYLRVVFIRTKKKIITKEDKRWYDYYAIVTNAGEHEMNDEKILDFYRDRSQAENFIKDLKYGMDFKHFPCQKLNANKVWGLAGIMAYNLMRFSAFLIDPKRGCFLKRTRKKLVHIACEVIRHARKITLRFHDLHYQEVKRIKEKIHLKFVVVRNDRSVTLPFPGS